jgi:hypothetical protein
MNPSGACPAGSYERDEVLKPKAGSSGLRRIALPNPECHNHVHPALIPRQVIEVSDAH